MVYFDKQILSFFYILVFYFVAKRWWSQRKRIPGRRTLKRMQRCCPMVLHRAVLQRARFERWVVSRVLPLIRFILKRASPPPITHRTYRRSGPVGDPEGGYIGRPRSMDMKCHHKIGREIWEWGMAEPFVV